MNIGRALTFFTEDERWVEKTAIGIGVILVSLLTSIVLVGLLGFLVLLGYSVRLIQNVRDDVHPALPEWNQWGADLGRGLKLFVVQFVWSLPILLTTVPLTIITAFLADSGRSGEELAGIVSLCTACISLVFGIAYAILQPGFTIAFIKNEMIGDGLQVSNIWNWTLQHIGDVIIVAIVYMVGSSLIMLLGGIVGTILCLVGLIVTIPLSILTITYFQSHLYGQLAQDDRDTTAGPEYDRGTTAGPELSPPTPPLDTEEMPAEESVAAEEPQEPQASAEPQAATESKEPEEPQPPPLIR